MGTWTEWNELVDPADRVTTAQFNKRPASVTKPTHVIIHITGTDDYAACKTRFVSGGASAHYLVKKDGTIVQFVKDADRAWHAGILAHVSKLYDNGTWKKYLRYFDWYKKYPGDAVFVDPDLKQTTTKPKGTLVKRGNGEDWSEFAFFTSRFPGRDKPYLFDVSKDPNSYSIGIEILTVGGKDKKKYEDGLYTGLDRLLTDLCEKYQIPRDREHIVGHEDVNPVERWGWDPDSGFDWDRILAATATPAVTTPTSTTPPSPTPPPKPPTEDHTIKSHSSNTESHSGFGYFPIGRNLTWHGGVHLLHSEATSIHNVFAGRVVGARLVNDKQDGVSNAFVLVRHEFRPKGAAASTPAKIFFSLHMHLAGEILFDTPVEWMQRVKGKFGASTTNWEIITPTGKLVVYKDSGDRNKPHPVAGAAGVMSRSGSVVTITGRFQKKNIWASPETGDVYVQIDFEGKPAWVRVMRGKDRSARPLVEMKSDAPQSVKDFAAGKAAFFGKPGDNKDLDAVLAVAGGEMLGHAGRLPSVRFAETGEHFEVFSKDDLVSAAAAGSFDDIIAMVENPKAVVRYDKDAPSSYLVENVAAANSMALTNKLTSPVAKRGTTYDVKSLREVSGKGKFALIDMDGKTYWSPYQATVSVYGTVSTTPEYKWFKIQDADNDIKYDKAAMGKILELISKADPAVKPPNEIMKRDEIVAFYGSNPRADSLRFTYLDAVSEWSIDPDAVFDDDRMKYLPREEVDAHKAELARFRLWKEIPGVMDLDGFGQVLDKAKGKVRHYRYHPLTFLGWLGREVGVVVEEPRAAPVATPAPVEPSPVASSGGGGTAVVMDASAYVRSDPPALAKTSEKIPQYTRVKVLETSGDCSKVEPVAGPPARWTKSSNLCTFYKDDSTLATATLAPDTAVAPSAGWEATKKKIAETYNRVGGLIKTLAGQTEVEVQAVLAVWYVESGGKSHVANSAIIRFENHLLYDFWGKDHEEDYRKHFKHGGHNGVTGNRWESHSFRKADTDDFSSFHGNQTKEYEVLAFAREKAGDEAALSSMSIGGCQIVVSQYRMIGYESARQMYDAFQADERYHVLGFFDFCQYKYGHGAQRGKMIGLLKEKKWLDFASGYNGTGQASSYEGWLKNAYDRAKEIIH